MSKLAEANNTEFFRASRADFLAQLSEGGWAFWRGVAVGFMASYPLAYIAMNGQAFGIGA